MEGYHIKDDSTRLYFRHNDNVSDEEEYMAVMSVLRMSGAYIGETKVMPYCDIVRCSLDGADVDVMRYIDGDGTFIYCEDEACMRKLEKLFGM